MVILKLVYTTTNNPINLYFKLLVERIATFLFAAKFSETILKDKASNKFYIIMSLVTLVTLSVSEIRSSSVPEHSLKLLFFIKLGNIFVL